MTIPPCSASAGPDSGRRRRLWPGNPRPAGFSASHRAQTCPEGRLSDFWAMPGVWSGWERCLPGTMCARGSPAARAFRYTTSVLPGPSAAQIACTRQGVFGTVAAAGLPAAAVFPVAAVVAVAVELAAVELAAAELAAIASVALAAAPGDDSAAHSQAAAARAKAMTWPR